MSKHTEGPWRVLPEEVHKDYIRVRGTLLGRRYKIANVLTVSYAGVPDSEAEETRANARLIAAAPDSHAANIVTIKALQLVYRFGEDADDQWIYDELGTELSSAYFMARAAIAKATGEQP